MVNNVVIIASKGFFRPSFARSAVDCFLLFVVLLLSLLLPVICLDGFAQEVQREPDSQEDSIPANSADGSQSSESLTESASEVEEVVELSEQERELVTNAVEDLSGSEFAQRERAAAALMELGKKAIPEMLMIPRLKSRKL